MKYSTLFSIQWFQFEEIKIHTHSSPFCCDLGVYIGWSLDKYCEEHSITLWVGACKSDPLYVTYPYEFADEFFRHQRMLHSIHPGHLRSKCKLNSNAIIKSVCQAFYRIIHRLHWFSQAQHLLPICGINDTIIVHTKWEHTQHDGAPQFFHQHALLNSFNFYILLRLVDVVSSF